MVHSFLTSRSVSADSAPGGVKKFVRFNTRIPYTFKQREPLNEREMENYVKRKEAEHLAANPKLDQEEDESELSDDDEQILEPTAVATHYDTFVKDVVRTSSFFKKDQSCNTK